MKAAKHIFRIELVDEAGVTMAADERELAVGDSYRYGPINYEVMVDGAQIRVPKGEMRFTWVGIER